MAMGFSSIIMRLSSLFATSRSRKLMILAITLLVVFGYIGPWVIHHNQTVKVTTGCLARKIKEIESDLNQVDASIVHADNLESRVDQVIPFVGNGKVGLVANVMKPNGILIKNEESWTSVSLYRPLVRAWISGMKDQSALVVNYRKAAVQRHQCFAVEESCVFVKTNTLMHRFRPSLMLQEIVVDNSGDVPVTLELARNGPHKWKGSTTTTEIVNVNGKTREYALSAGDFVFEKTAEMGRQVISLVVAATTFDKKIEIQARTVHKQQIVTLVKYTNPMAASTPQLTAGLVDEVDDELFKLLHMDFKELVREHEDAWSQQIWNTGFVQEPLAIPINPKTALEVSKQLKHISTVHVFNILTTAVVYYMMSSTEAPLMMPSISLQRKKEVIAALQQPGSCFNGQPTLYEELLWRPVQTDTEMSDLLSHWQHVLYKHGCHSLLSVGVTGIMQAMILSFLAGQFTERELSFHADPLLFRNKFHLHNIFYNTSFLHIDIDPSPGKQEILISTTSVQPSDGITTTKQLYACGTGCNGTPIILSSSMQRIPLRWTEPQTPFLYISHDPKHLEFLRTKIIHYKHIHDFEITIVQVLLPLSGDGEKGQNQGFQMPLLVWVIIIGLIIIFHGFLLNLVYREYCSGSKGGGPKLSEKTSKA